MGHTIIQSLEFFPVEVERRRYFKVAPLFLCPCAGHLRCRGYFGLVSFEYLVNVIHRLNAHPNSLFTLPIIVNQLLIAISPLLALFYIIYTGFEPEEVERKKREQTGDFQLDGHAE